MKTEKEIISLMLLNQRFIVSLGVAKIAIFGSVSRNEQNADSDVDIFVEFYDNKKNYDNFINLCYFLEDEIGSDVELVTKESLSPSMLSAIEKELHYVELAS